MRNKIFEFALFMLFITCSMAAYSQPANSSQITAPKDKAYGRVHIDDLKPLTYPYLRESDVFWEKRVWRVVDLREKINQPLYYPETPQGSWRSLMQVLWDAVLGGEITAYEYNTATDNFELLLPLTANQVEQNLSDSVMRKQQDPNDPNAFIDVKTLDEFEPTDVLRFLIKEDWIFDKQRSEMQVRILGICPQTPDILETGELSGYKNLFWLYFDEIRPILARSEVFNLHNSANRLSYDEFFLTRQFSSYITKEDNVYNRQIREYTLGIDALLESDRIKEELRNFEGELWTY